MSTAGSRARQRVGVFFGGVSPEHEVSVISGLQALAALDSSRWEAVPVYVDKNGGWWMGPELGDPTTFKKPIEESDGVHRVSISSGAGGRLSLVSVADGELLSRLRKPLVMQIDVVLPVMHGGSGEDGSLQGLCETLGVAYAGSGPLSAALAMDKAAAKRWAATFQIPQVGFRIVPETEWSGKEEAVLDALEEQPGLPAVVKPSSLGSSIGISVATSRQELDAAIEEALRYDAVVVVEEAVSNLRELNCSVLGGFEGVSVSLIEEPLSGDALLSFRDKYMRGGGQKQGTKSAPTGGMASLDRKIPAPITEDQASTVRALAEEVFAAFDCDGVVRIDFMLDESSGRILFNEINTIPGSLSFYLWEPSGVSFSELLSRVLDAGLARRDRNQGRLRTYDVNLLSERDLAGLKGAKS